MQNSENPKDLLHRLSPQENTKETTVARLTNQEKQHEQPDLNLSLSLGGIYGENSKGKSLAISSSISGVLTPDEKTGELLDTLVPKSFLSLARSSSLPTEAEQQQRKEIFNKLARTSIEATRRFVNQRNPTMDFDKEKSPAPDQPMPASQLYMAAWAAAYAAKTPAFRHAIFKIKAHLAFYGSKKHEGLEEWAVEKDGSSSQSLTKQNDPRAHIIWGTNANGISAKDGESKLENPYKKLKNSHNGFEDRAVGVMRQMPSVTARGDGPNGRKIEGFLCKYTKGQVSIVCVCHGSFLSPAEFVKHAGGKDLSNPLKHITVSSTPLSFENRLVALSPTLNPK